MKVRILRTCAALGEHREAGQVYDFPDKIARELIALRRAVALEQQIEVRDPQIAIGDAAEQPFTRTSKRK